MRFRIGGTVINLDIPKRALVSVLLTFCLCVLLLHVLQRNAHSPEDAADYDYAGAIPIDRVLRRDNDAHSDVKNDVKDDGNSYSDVKQHNDVANDEAYDEFEDEPKRPHQKNLDKGRNERPHDVPTGNSFGHHQGKQDGVVKMAIHRVKDEQKTRITKDHYRLVKSQNRAPDSRYNINVTHSDILSPDRELPDTRPPSCNQFTYDIQQLPEVSVIIPFYNEALSMILRTVHSVLNRSPDQLLREVILVDDKSTDQHLQSDSLERHLKLLPKVKLLRNPSRVGLVVSRMNGLRMSTAPIIMFLDAHAEVNAGWLEPLLDELRRNPNQIIQPFIDGIDAMNLQYSDPDIFHKGAFSWDLRYTWIRVAEHEQLRAIETGHPFPTPTMVGCAIVANKTYFQSIGAFDESLKIWGGENSELSFRTWMCGGKVMTITCSRIGHVFKNFPYSFDGNKEETVQKNLMRVAETWMDGTRKYFYASTRSYSFKRAELTSDELVTLQERKDLRKRLNCHNFEWYLYNIIPEIDIPPMDAAYYGEIMNIHSRGCWEITEDYFVGMTYLCYDHKIIPKNNFALTTDGLLRYRDKCVTVSPPKPQMVVGECPDKNNIQQFGWWQVINKDVVWGNLKVTQLNDDGTSVEWCIVQVTNAMSDHKGEQMPQLGTCSDSDQFQMWAFTYAFDFSRVPPEIMATPI